MPGGKDELNEEEYLKIDDTEDDRALELDESKELEAEEESGLSTDETDTAEADNEELQAVPVENVPDSVGSTMAEAHNAVMEKRNQLRQSKVKHLGMTIKDGPKMTSLKDAIDELTQKTFQPVDKNKADFVKSLESIRESYRTLIFSCEDYLDYFSGKDQNVNDVGEMRIDLARSIMRQSQKELDLLESSEEDLYSHSKSLGSDDTWDVFLSTAHVETIRKEVPVEEVEAISPEKKEPEEDKAKESSERLAENIGMGNVVAKKENEQIKNNEGTIEDKIPEEEVVGDTMDVFTKAAKDKGFTVQLSPETIRQMYETQVFDLMTGQKNRGLQDFVPEYELTGEKEFTITSVKAINNKATFSSTSINHDEIGDDQMALLDGDDKVATPFLPKDFYDRVMDFNAASIYESQGDILNMGQLMTLGARIIRVKNRLQGLVGNGKIKLTYSDKDWDQAKDEIIRRQREGKLARNYIPLDLIS